MTQVRDARRREFKIFGILKRLWIPLLVVVVVVAGGFAVMRLRAIFGSDDRPSYADTKNNDTRPFNPKHMIYEVFGAPGTVANISYFDLNADPQHIEGASLPWSLDIAMSDAAAVGSVVAQGDSDNIGCRIIVDGKVKTEKVSDQVNAFTSCLLKSA
jgi:nitrate reductase NapE component